MADLNKRGRKANPKRYELSMIADKWEELSDEELATRLNRPIKFVVDLRKDMRLFRPEDEEFESPNVKTASQLPNVPMSKEEAKAKGELEDSLQFQTVRALLSPQEENFYIKKYIKFVSSMDELMPSEQDSVHLMIMELIRQNRILEEEKKYRDHPHLDGREDFKTQYNKSLEQFRHLQRSLKASREQRLKGRMDSSITLVSVVQQLNEEKTRSKNREDLEKIQKEKEIWEQENGSVVTAGE